MVTPEVGSRGDVGVRVLRWLLRLVLIFDGGATVLKVKPEAFSGPTLFGV